MHPLSHRLAVLAALLLICGCYNPYPRQGWRGQPGYYPAQPGQLQSPGQLYIPPSNAPLAAPGTNYDEDPDDFNRDNGDSGSFFPEDNDGAVPRPREPDSGSGGFNDDFNGGF